MRDVAEKAKVTTSTVSRVLNQSALVKPRTRQNVLDAIESLGYIPSQTARIFKSGKSYILGLVISQSHISHIMFNAGFQAQFKALTEKAHKEGYNILLITSAEGDSESYFEVIKNQVADGFIIFSPSHNDGLTSLLEEAEIPYVFNMKYSDKPEDHYYVSSDDVEGGFIAGKYLLDLNHTDIRFLVGNVKGGYLPFNADRIKGFKKALDMYHVPFREEMIVKVQGQMNESYNGIHMLFQTERPTALMISNEITTVAALNYFTDNGYRVPRDVSVIGFGPSEFFRSLRPNLTNVSYDISWASAKLVDLLLQRIEGKPVTIEMPKKPELIIRDSTARNMAR
nr:LacI family DNA-binding transcriptional regulator [Paenibacillus piri]